MKDWVTTKNLTALPSPSLMVLKSLFKYQLEFGLNRLP